MLSNPLHRFSPYHNMQSPSLVSNSHVQQSSPHSNHLDSRPGGPAYGMQQMQHVNIGNSHHARSTTQSRQRQHPYGANGRGSVSGPVRRRISRACDQCNQLRTKCDGQHPCAHCIEFGLGCEYVRERKKRGKASRKDLAQQAAAHAAATGEKADSGAENSTANDSPSEAASNKRAQARSQTKGDGKPTPANQTAKDPREDSQHPADESLETLDALSAPRATVGASSSNGMDQPAYANGTHRYEGPSMDSQMIGDHAYTNGGHAMPSYSDLHYGMQNQSSTNAYNHGSFRMETSPLGGYGIGANATSPGWGVSMSSPTGQYQPAAALANGNPNAGQLRYPVLEPLIPHLGNIMPISLACDLIDLYFSSSSSAQMHPMSPYVLGFVFRKRAFLHPTRPRRCQPALLASMLWVGAQTSDASLLTSVPSARGKVCQKLLELTVSLLKPLIHTPSGEISPAGSPAAAEGVALGGLGVALPGSISMDALSGENGPFGAAGTLDDVITYIHLATVVSASEYKGASIRWWNAAWSLARELKLGRELPPNGPQLGQDIHDTDHEGLDDHDRKRNNPDFVTEEEREERRRIWWLVYIVDRHLALCYNRPLFLLDIECDGLLQPIDDTAWQSGDFGMAIPSNTDPALGPMSEGSSSDAKRIRGVNFECRGHSIFGYFLPLMTILGEIVDLHHARNHPRFGINFRNAREWDDQAAEITRHLEMYEQSLRRFEAQYLPKVQEEKSDLGHDLEHAADIGTPSVHSVHTNSSNRMTESDIQARIVLAYGTHVMHVLHILLAGKWDPINLLDDNDLWISSEGFLTSTSHAVSAAEAINQILEYDPGLEFMPFFFGIYLLQGSFLLLLIADKLQFEASPSVVRACETIVRAHEACVVTLNTEYQRNFSKVMRSALAQVRGRVPEDLNEQHQRRRELLALYRWTGDGTGLAL